MNVSQQMGWLSVFLYCKSISVLGILCVCDIVERQQEVVEEGEDQVFIEEDVREENGDKGDEVVFENKYKGKIKYEDLKQPPGGGNIGGGGYVGGA